ncbi:hypothetical protein QTN47_13795 [Danxiaibacter flavus]|uniref:DUF2306 domain-containing protein n=1 Tax=Danxiaibacter flavus TaxID=3049108 RepID=A0ABV3ZFD4_9BACT|nr:hypothetical protein QNM32_13800 [Chitinophagaceae bacterium DXS]
MQLFQTLLILHIAGGSLGLLAGTIAASALKGRKWHLLAGRLFFYGMFIASASSLIITNMPGHENVFLFAIAGFTLYMASSGYRMIILKRKQISDNIGFSWVDYAVLIFGLTFGLFLCLLAIKGILKGNLFGLVPSVFGVLCLWFSLADLGLIAGKKAIKQVWLYNHIIRMVGALVAAYTAFLVVNVHVNQGWILWLAPALIGTFIIIFFIRKFVSGKDPQTI